MQNLRYSRYFKSIFIALDLMLLLGVLFYSPGLKWISGEPREEFFLVSFVLLSYWFLLSGTTKIYQVPRNLTFTLYFQRLLTQIIAFIFGVFIILRLTDGFLTSVNLYYIGFRLLLVILLVKSIVFFGLKYTRLLGLNHRNVMFLAEDDSSLLLRETLDTRKDYGFKIFDFSPQNFNLNELVAFWKENGIHTLFMPAESALCEIREEELLKAASKYNVKVILIPSILDNRFLEYDLAYVESQPILSPAKFPLELPSNFALKRILDISVSALALFLICSWLFPLIALFIKRDSKGSVFFVQKRYGKNNVIFNCIKFRTMYENDFSTLKTTEINDSRITRFGKFLRRTSLDELPQLVNVLTGEMSLVGPRPHMLVVDDFYKSKIGRYNIRSKVQPGMTGLAQVSGLRGDEKKAALQMKKRILADAFYVKNWSLSMDFVILLKTTFLMLAGDKNAR